MESECTTESDGTKIWYSSPCVRHREDGPAYIGHNGDKSWWINGRLHREDGPAIERANGDKEWYLDGEEVTEAHIICLSRQRKLELV